MSASGIAMEQGGDGRGKTLWICSPTPRKISLHCRWPQHFKQVYQLTHNNMTVHWQWLGQYSLRPKNAFFS